MFQFIGGGSSWWKIKTREMTFPKFKLDRHGVCDFLTSRNSTMHPLPVMICECFIHFSRTFQIKLCRIHFHARSIISKSTSVHTKQDILGFSIFTIHVMTVASRNWWDTHFIRKINRSCRYLTLQIQAIVLNFNEITVFKNLLEPTCDLSSFVK